MEHLQHYETLKPVTLNGGLFVLDKEQARRRALFIELVGDLRKDGSGTYKTNNRGSKGLNFKAGEIVGFDGPIHKAITGHVNVVKGGVFEKAAKASNEKAEELARAGAAEQARRAPTQPTK